MTGYRHYEGKGQPGRVREERIVRLRMLLDLSRKPVGPWPASEAVRDSWVRQWRAELEKLGGNNAGQAS